MVGCERTPDHETLACEAEIRGSATGITIGTYEPAGEIVTGSF